MASQAPAAGACLGDDTIAGMLEGVLAEDHARRARAHIATCVACRRLVSAAIEGPGSAESRSAVTVRIGGAQRDGLAPGFVIAGKYRIERVLGEGGMGRVFAARQLGLEREVAIKILRPELVRDGMALARFQREARLVAALASEHVIRVHDFGALDTGEPYLVMEWLEGEDLATIIQRGPVRTEFAVSWILAACRALAESHALGIVHRDIKPSNLFVTTTGRLVVLDFGLAKLAARDGASGAAGGAGATITAHGVMLGSPRYMAPEQITGARDAGIAADVWGLGATLYHLVSGAPPFDAPSIEAVFSKILAGSMPDFARVPAVIAAVVRRALAFDPAARFASVDELAAALEPCAPEIESPGFAGARSVAEGRRGVAIESPGLAGARSVAEGRRGVAIESPGFAGARSVAEGRRGVAIDRYQPIELLGQGGHGAVYRARQEPHGREVALKVLTASGPSVRERFAREAAIVQQLEHPNTVRLYEYGIAGDGAPYMVFELVRGRTLASEIARGPLQPQRVARIAAQALKALMEAHARGIVHRDVTPANIQLVDHAGEPDFVKLLDFGVAIASPGSAGARNIADGYGASPNLTATGQVVGTPRYMAPEQVTGAAVDARCDLYALGLVMAEALVGAPVYAGDSAMATCIQQASLDPVPLLPAVVTGPLGAVIVTATTKPVHGRFASARDMLAAIEAPAAAPPTRAAISLRALAIGAACVAILGLGIALAAIKPWERDDAAEVPQPKPSVLIGTGHKGQVIIGENVVGPKPMKEVPAPSGGAGPLGNIDEARLRARLIKLGWAVKETERNQFPGCSHTRLRCERGALADGTYAWADVFFLECESRVEAAASRARLSKVPGNWVVDDGDLVLDVATNVTAGSDEKRSKALFDQLVVP